ncbi:MAG: M20/M25/M40 family metallo-hydrolase, partial [Casimicrobiaceae bacterium]
RNFRDQGRFDDAYDVPYTTVHTGVIHGGTAVNIVPLDCWFDFEIRHLPFDDPGALLTEVRAYAERLRPEMHAVNPDTGIVFEELSAMTFMEVSESSDIVALAKACSGSHASGKVSFGTEGALFQLANIPTVVCGPGHIAQAHQPDEWVSVEQLAQCEAFMQRLTERCTAR